VIYRQEHERVSNWKGIRVARSRGGTDPCSLSFGHRLVKRR
jgi:hypothetical protein